MNDCQPTTTDDELNWTSPFVYGPTLLFITALISFKRSTTGTTSKFIQCLRYIVISTFVLDSCTLITRILLRDDDEPSWTFTTDYSYYIGISWIAWTITTIKDCNIYFFWEFSVITETIVGWLKLQNTDDDQVSFGIFITRYIVEITIVILSWTTTTTTEKNQQEEIESLVRTTQQKTHYGTTTTTTTTKYYMYTSGITSWNTIWPTKSQCMWFFVVCMDILVSILAPHQLGHVVDEWRSGIVLAYVGLTFLQGLFRKVEYPSDQLVLFVIANTFMTTLYTVYLYGVTLSIVLFGTTALHICCILHSSSRWMEVVISSGGLLWASVFFGRKVATCELSAGDFVAFNMYLIQLNSLHSFRTCVEKTWFIPEEEEGPKMNQVHVEPEQQRPIIRKIESQIIHIEPSKTTTLTETIELYEEEDN